MPELHDTDSIYHATQSQAEHACLRSTCSRNPQWNFRCAESPSNQKILQAHGTFKHGPTANEITWRGLANAESVE